MEVGCQYNGQSHAVSPISYLPLTPLDEYTYGGEVWGAQGTQRGSDVNCDASQHRPGVLFSCYNTKAL